MIFPIEIWEQIFLHSDPVVLTNFKSVCKSWKEVIERILQVNPHWQRKCKAEIPVDNWDALVEKLFPHKPYIDIDNDQMDSQMWMDVCKLWIKHKQLTKCNITIETLEPLAKHRASEIITCTRASRELLAIGSSEGYIYFYEINDLKKCLLWRLDHKEHVCDVQFLRNERKICTLSSSINNHVKVWDMRAKELVKSVHGKLICASHDFCYILTRNMLIVEGPMPRKTFQVELDDFTVMTATKNKVTLLEGYFQALFKSKVYLYSDKGFFVKATLEEKREICTSHFITRPSFNIRRYYLFKNDLLACITEDGLLGFSVHGKEWNIHHIFPCLLGIPTAVLIYLNLLILGLDSGEVHIFYVEDFETLDFKSMEPKKITLGTKAIVALEIIVSSGELYLAAANDKLVHVITFN